MVFGALAASAAAVNVALQFISNAGSLTGSIGGDSSASRKRKHEEDDDSYMPALIASMADDEAIARLGEYISHTRVNTWWEEFRSSDDPNPERWIANFRVSKSTFDYICNLVKPDLESATPANFMNIEGRFISVEKQVAIALRRLASGYAHNTIGELFGVGTSTVCKTTWKFIKSMQRRAMHHMQWPRGEEMEHVKEGFRKLHGMPNCCGAVDVTHIVMELQVGDSTADWFDREHNYSMVVQAVVDSDGRIRDVFTGLPGSVTDSGALRSSGLYRRCENGDILNGPVQFLNGFPLREYIIGDEGYPLRPWLISPYPLDVGGLPSIQDNFNYKHMCTRMVVEVAFARLKGAWRILHHTMWRPDLKKLPHLILCCCLLHNIMIDKGEDLQDGIGLFGHHDENYKQQSVMSIDPIGSYLRDALANHLFFEGHS